MVHKVKVKMNAVATLTLCTIYKDQGSWKNMGKFADAFTQNSWQALISDTYSFTTIVSEYPLSILKAYLLSRTGNGREQTCRPLPEPRRATHLFPSARGFAPLSGKQMQILPPCRFRAFFDSTYLDNSIHRIWLLTSFSPLACVSIIIPYFCSFVHFFRNAPYCLFRGMRVKVVRWADFSKSL